MERPYIELITILVSVRKRSTLPSGQQSSKLGFMAYVSRESRHTFWDFRQPPPLTWNWRRSTASNYYAAAAADGEWLGMSPLARHICSHRCCCRTASLERRAAAVRLDPSWCCLSSPTDSGIFGPLRPLLLMLLELCAIAAFFSSRQGLALARKMTPNYANTLLSLIIQ